MQQLGWFGVVMGHSRSWAKPPFDRAHTTSCSTLIKTLCLSFTVFEIIVGYLSKVADFNPPHLHLPSSWGGDPGRISRRSLATETRVPELSCGFVCMILRLAVLVELRFVTDTDTDRQTQAHG